MRPGSFCSLLLLKVGDEVPMEVTSLTSDDRTLLLGHAFHWVSLRRRFGGPYGPDKGLVLPLVPHQKRNSCHSRLKAPRVDARPHLLISK